ncbi:MAG: DUF4012 domain-containing protein [Acidimicrobiales bacterium]
MITRRRVLLALVLLVLGVGFAARCAYVLAGTARDLDEAEELIDQAVRSLGDGEVADARSTLARAQELVLSANESLRGSIELEALGLLPVAKQNLRSIEDSVALAAMLVHGGGRILHESIPLESEDGTLEVSLSDGTIPLDSVERARHEIEALRTEMAPVLREAPSRYLLEPVSRMRQEVYERASERDEQLDVLGRGLALLSEIAGGNGPRRYMLAVANTAEMRGSGGMILNYGLLEGTRGTIDLTEFGRIDEIPVDAAVSAEVAPADYVARWDGFEALRRFRQANLAGDYTVVAPVLEALYAQATGIPVHGVIQVDPQGLAAILEGVGPVTVPELGVVTADNVVQLTLNEAYIRFPDVEQRSDVLGDVAEAAFRKLVDGDFPSLRGLAEAIVAAVDGRHILMHATASTVEADLTAFGADGAYPDVEDGDSFALTAQNLAGNKLDYYLDTDLRLSGSRPADAFGAIEAEVTLTNTAPSGVTQPQYIFGPGPGPTAVPAGVLRSLVTLYLPLGTTVEGVSGDATVEPTSSGTEDGRGYVSFIVDVPAAQARTVGLTLRLAPRPPGPHELIVVPSPRVRPTSLDVDVRAGADRIRGRVALDRAWRFSTESEPVEIVAPALR